MSYVIKYLYIKLLILHIPGFSLVGEEWVAWDRGQVQKGQKRILIVLSWEEKKMWRLNRKQFLYENAKNKGYIRTYFITLLGAIIAPNYRALRFAKNIFVRNCWKWYLFRGYKQANALLSKKMYTQKMHPCPQCLE